MKEVHGTQGIFQKVGEFPNAGDTEYPMAALLSLQLDGRGAVDVDPPIPPNDVTLIGTTNKVLTA